MPDITRDESYALQAAGGHLETSDERLAFRAGWLAGREYQRQQQATAQAHQLVARGLRLLGCQHAASCRSVDECSRRG